MRISEVIRAHIIAAQRPMKADDNIAEFIFSVDERRLLIEEVAGEPENVFKAMLIDTASDPNTRHTAERVARMYIDEVFAGRYRPPPAVTDFPNTKNLDEMYLVGPISIRRSIDAIDETIGVLGALYRSIMLSGSRAVLGERCPKTSDWDVLVYVSRNNMSECSSRLLAADFVDESEEFDYADSPIQSFRRGDLNVLLTDDPDVVAATHKSTALCRAFNLTRREDRIAVHRIIRDNRPATDPQVAKATNVGELLARVAKESAI